MTIFENKLLQIFFTPLGWIYSLVIFFRNKFYDWNLIPVRKLTCKVISLGNITVGGTGKTPAVEFLANYLLGKGKRVVILSRGYKRKSQGTVVVSDGRQILVSPREAGDEPYLLAKKLKGVPIIVDKNRYQGGLLAQKKFGPEYILLDDGFQHRRLARDMDIVLVDATVALGPGLVPPPGFLREPLTNLSRAHMIWLTRVDQCSDLIKFKRKIKRYTPAPLILTRHRPVKLVQTLTMKEVNLNEISDRRVFAFSGIGNPHAFEKTLKGLGAHSVALMIFFDHHFYTTKDLKKIQDQAEKSGAELIITTEKDWVRLPKGFESCIPFYYLEIEMEVVEGEGLLERFFD